MLCPGFVHLVTEDTSESEVHLAVLTKLTHPKFEPLGKTRVEPSSKVDGFHFNIYNIQVCLGPSKDFTDLST